MFADDMRHTHLYILFLFIVSMPAGYTRIAFLSDFHIPFHDPAAIRLAFDIVRWKNCDKIVVGGDLLDFYTLSSFDKDPERTGQLQSELNTGMELLRKLRAQNPDAEIIFLEGNHEARLERHLRRHPQLWGLEALTIPELLCFGSESININKFIPYDEGWRFKNFLFVHGSMVRKHSAYTAKGHLEKYGISGICGHSHRLGAHYKRDKDGQKGWWENGCLCDLSPEYTSFPNWEQGFHFIDFENNGSRFHVTPCVIMDGECMIGDKVYSV